MASILAITVIGAMVIAVIVGGPIWRRRRRRARAAGSFPDPWAALLEHRLPLYARVPMQLRAQLHGLILNLLAEKQFVGCAELEISDEMRLIIAAQAALLLFNQEGELYPQVQSILVYPDRFFAEHRVRDAAGVLSRERRLLSGEAWEQGKVIVSWRDVHDSTADPLDGYNVVLHEFAHALDHEGGSANGLPPLPASMDAGEWQRAFADAYDRLCRRVDADEPTLIDPYGAESPAEFFAVATETFFELAPQLREQEPELYEQLARFYGLDPAQWYANPALEARA